MAKKKSVTNNVKIVSIVSAVLLLVEIFGLLMILTGYSSVQAGVLDIVILILMAYFTYKTLIKKENLTTFEWIIFIILAVLMILAFLVGFIIGVTSAIGPATGS